MKFFRLLRLKILESIVLKQYIYDLK